MDYKDYHPDWKDLIRPAVLKRDKYECQVCRIKHKSRVYLSSQQAYIVCDDFVEQWAKNTGRKVFSVFLAVAHIDHDKTNNTWSNLLTLCPRHHSLHDAQHKKFRGIVKEAKKTPEFLPVQDLEIIQLKECIAAVRIMVKDFTGTNLTPVEADSIIKLISKFS